MQNFIVYSFERNRKKVLNLLNVIHIGNIQNLCVIVNVGRNILSETYLATSGLAGNHWACFQAEFLSTDIFYCNSLAWPAPPNFIVKLKFLTLLIKVNYPNMPDFQIYVVNKDTERNVFPY